jgi:hypothetical protein
MTGPNGSSARRPPARRARPLPSRRRSPVPRKPRSARSTRCRRRRARRAARSRADRAAASRRGRRPSNGPCGTEPGPACAVLQDFGAESNERRRLAATGVKSRHAGSGGGRRGCALGRRRRTSGLPARTGTAHAGGVQLRRARVRAVRGHHRAAHVLPDQSPEWALLRNNAADIARSLDQIAELGSGSASPATPRCSNVPSRSSTRTSAARKTSCFRGLQRRLSPRQLRALGLRWELVRRIAPTRPHPLVSRRPPGQALSALPLTVLDRGRGRAVPAATARGAHSDPPAGRRLGRTRARGRSAVRDWRDGAGPTRPRWLIGYPPGSSTGSGVTCSARSAASEWLRWPTTAIPWRQGSTPETREVEVAGVTILFDRPGHHTTWDSTRRARVLNTSRRIAPLLGRMKNQYLANARRASGSVARTRVSVLARVPTRMCSKRNSIPTLIHPAQTRLVRPQRPDAAASIRPIGATPG